MEPLQGLFAATILKQPELPPDPTDERVYDLTPVREPGFEFVYDSGSGIQDVVVTSKRPTAVTALTAPKVRKRSRLFILVSLSDSCGGRCSDNSTRRAITGKMCGDARGRPRL